MHFVQCSGPCRGKVIVFDASEINGKWYCEPCEELVFKFKTQQVLTPPKIIVAGFTEPEDGSQKRYVDRRKKQPWLAHTAWWIVHNAIAHPLIAVAPWQPFFQFHDWTSRKMHGR